MDENWIYQAIRNNAVWCDKVCAAQGSHGEFQDGFWVSHDKTPPFFPNFITLDKDKTTEQRVCIQELLNTGVGELGIKDSFSNLELGNLGFQILFDAEWIYLPRFTPIRSTGKGISKWNTITDEYELRKWEQAWRGMPKEKISDTEAIFQPKLLLDNQLVFVAAYEQGQIVAGAVGLETDQVVGVSNVFISDDTGIGYRGRCISQLRTIYPDKVLVGYENGQELENMLKIGFERIGALRVWVRKTIMN